MKMYHGLNAVSMLIPLVVLLNSCVEKPAAPPVDNVPAGTAVIVTEWNSLGMSLGMEVGSVQFSTRAMAEEIGMSRILGGLHFTFSNRDALDGGREMGEYVFDNFLAAR